MEFVAFIVNNLKIKAMKTIKNISLIIFALLFLGINLYAGDTKTKKTRKLKSIAERIDSELKIENWMTELKCFNTMESSTYNETMALETWMTELKSFNATDLSFYEEPMSLEAWMINIHNRTWFISINKCCYPDFYLMSIF